jgi:hypothetical protein
MAECGRAYRFRFSWTPLAVALLRDPPHEAAPRTVLDNPASAPE